MTDYQWMGTVSTDASVADNWLPVAVPGSGDKAIYHAGSAQDCNLNIATIDEIEVQSGFLHTVEIGTDITLSGLSVSAAGSISSSVARGLTFTGTPLYKSSSCYVEIGTSSSPFDSVSSRGNLTFTMTPASGDLYFDTGIYPNIKLGGSGNKTPQYISPTVSNTTDVNFLTLRISAGTFGPASATPTDNDKLKNFIIDESTSQLTIDAGGLTSFDGGYATWTFQGATSGFLIPTSNLADYQGCDFTFRKMSIVATDAGAGAWAKIAANSRLCLDEFTVGVGASVKGAGASAIHLVNRPTIKGTWGFFPIADGIYHHKDGEVLGVAYGGTGLSDVAEYEIPFGTDGNVLTTSSRFTFNNNLNELTVDGKLTVSGLIDPTGMEFTPVAANPGGVAANTLWLDSGDSNKLKLGSTEVGSGGGGGGGTVDVVSNVATNTILGRNDSGSGDSEELTPAEVRTMLNVADGATAYADSDAISAIEGEADLVLTGDVSLAANKELTINESTYSASSKNNDDTKVLVSADSTGTNDALFRVDTDAGFLRIGPQNTGYCHFYTDRNSFYFNRNIEMDGGSFQAYNDDLQILTTTTSGDATRIYVDAGVDECRVGIGNGFTSSNLPEKELHVRGNMVIEDPTSDGSSDHLLEIKSASSSTPDNARVLISADTDAKLPMLHLRDIEANSGTFSTHYSAYMALDRATPIVSGSAQNDLLIANGNLNKDIHLCTNGTSNGTQAVARLTVVGSDGDVGIGTTSPAQKLHVNGTIRQTNATSAVLAADSNGDIGAASALTNAATQSFTALPALGPPAAPGTGDATHADLSNVHATLSDIVAALQAFGIL
jgi:hypothetical protein